MSSPDRSNSEVQANTNYQYDQWAVLERDLRDDDLDVLERELGLRMPWAFRESEFVLGYRVLHEGIEEATYLRVTRRYGEGHRLAPGVLLEVVTNVMDEDLSRWEELRNQSVTVFGRLAVS